MARGLGVRASAREEATAPPLSTNEYRSKDFAVTLRADTQTLVRLSPLSDPLFSFTPFEREPERRGNGYVHLGDLHLRIRLASDAYRDYSSAKARASIIKLRTGPSELAAADITATMGPGIPLTVERRWLWEGDALVLRFLLRNSTKREVEITVLGMPMVFDNILTGRSLVDAHNRASFVDPYIGLDAGYLQVTRLSGQGPALLVLPDAHSPLEAYSPIFNPGEAPAGAVFTDETQRSQTFEGFYDWTVASRGFREHEWRAADDEWNEATSIRLAPGAARSVGVRLVLASSIRGIESALMAHGRPVAVGIPGYVVPMDLDATLFLRSPVPVSGIAVWPAGALSVENAGTVAGWARFQISGKEWGRARLSLRYADHSTQTISYFVTKPARQTVSDLAGFVTARQFYDDPADPFGRAPALLTFDRDAGKVLTQEARVWLAGMSDEGGAGSWVALAMKELDNPLPDEVAKLERIVNETVVGKLQVAQGPHVGGVKKSLFYYDPTKFPSYYSRAIDWKTWASWPKKAADSLVRSYNYPHVAIGHWVLYRLARYHEGLVRQHGWRWYLDHACLTAVAMMREAPHYAQFGQMEGDVFVAILRDLQREGLSQEAAELEALMARRAIHWKSLPYPFASEMPWDSTGQPEVYAWLRYFGDDKKADATREVILGYDPTIPSWGYNGNARRYWDFLYAGKLPRIERQIHHYGSALTAVPLLDAYRRDPRDLHLLRVAYGGLLGALTNIDRDGFASTAFHSYPDQMRFDAFSGDYGMGFFGHAFATATYLVNDPTFGWLGFGGNVSKVGGEIRIEPKDSARSRLFVAPVRLWIEMQSGKIDAAEYSPSGGGVTLYLAPTSAHTPVAYLSVAIGGSADFRYVVSGVGIGMQRGLYAVRLGHESTVVHLSRAAA